MLDTEFANKFDALTHVKTSEVFNFKTLEVSSAHIPEETDVALSEDSDKAASLHHALRYEAMNLGWLIHVNLEQEDAASDLDHPELARLIRFARNCGYQQLRISSTGPRLPSILDFSVFEW